MGASSRSAGFDALDCLDYSLQTAFFVEKVQLFGMHVCGAQNLMPLYMRPLFRSGTMIGREFVGLLRQSRRHLVQVSGKRSQRRQRGRKRRKGAAIRRHGHAHASSQHTNQPARGHPHSHGERNGVLQECVLADACVNC